ncbi:MAG: HPr family phosphocarrier protein [Proteobacteria bacterium]|nr:HPr family phosphocarrier protein [Pseudomonadota bacterium]
MSEKSRQMVISNRLGLHARAAGRLVETASRFESIIVLEKNGQSADAKSVIDLLGLECPMGTRVLISASGADSDQAVETLAELIENKFGEE